MAEERRPSPNIVIVFYVLVGITLGILIIFTPRLISAILLLLLGLLCFVFGWITYVKIMPNYSTRHEWRRDTILYYFQPKDPPRLGQWGRYKGKPEEDWNFRMKTSTVTTFIIGVFLLVFSIISFFRAFS